MIAWPWYLLSAGAMLLVAGYVASMANKGGPGGPAIDPRMSDDEIRRQMEGGSGPAWPGLLIFAGLCCALVWRLALMFF